MKLSVNAGTDVLYIPYEPVSEEDNLEVRIQIKNSAESGTAKIGLYLDGKSENDKLAEGSISIEKNSWGFFNTFKKMTGMAGNHVINICYGEEGGDPVWIEKKLHVRKYSPNLIEGAFFHIGPAPDYRYPASVKRAEEIRALTDKNWEEQIDSYNEIGQKMLVMMSTIQFDDLKYRNTKKADEGLKAFYPSKYYGPAAIAAKEPIDTILKTAEKNGQGVFMATGNQFSILDKYTELMDEIYELYGHYESFYGWYLPIEPTVCRSLKEFEWFLDISRKIREKADELSPAKPLLVSVTLADYDHLNDTLHTGLHREIYDYFKTGNAPFQIIAPMDSVGCAELSLDRVQSFYSVLRDSCKDTPLHIWANAESFDIDGQKSLAPRYIGGGFDGEQGLVQQIAYEKPYVEKVITFQLTSGWAKEGLAPEPGGKKAVEQYMKYQEYMKHPLPSYCNIASGKKYSRSLHPQLPGRKKLNPDRRDQLPCVPDIDSTTATDGVLASGFVNGTGHDKMFGYYAMDPDKDLQVDIIIDLEKESSFDIVRSSHVTTKYFSADRISVSVSSDGNEYKHMGDSDSYKLGWISVQSPGTCARFVKITFFKKCCLREYDYKNDENFSSMIIDEIEVLSIYHA